MSPANTNEDFPLPEEPITTIKGYKRKRSMSSCTSGSRPKKRSLICSLKGTIPGYGQAGFEEDLGSECFNSLQRRLIASCCSCGLVALSFTRPFRRGGSGIDCNTRGITGQVCVSNP